jgi:hypothetical protein
MKPIRKKHILVGQLLRHLSMVVVAVKKKKKKKDLVK